MDFQITLKTESGNIRFAPVSDRAKQWLKDGGIDDCEYFEIVDHALAAFFKSVPEDFEFATRPPLRLVK